MTKLYLAPLAPRLLYFVSLVYHNTWCSCHALKALFVLAPYKGILTNIWDALGSGLNVSFIPSSKSNPLRSPRSRPTGANEEKCGCAASVAQAGMRATDRRLGKLGDTWGSSCRKFRTLETSASFASTRFQALDSMPFYLNRRKVFGVGP